MVIILEDLYSSWRPFFGWLIFNLMFDRKHLMVTKTFDLVSFYLTSKLFFHRLDCKKDLLITLESGINAGVCLLVLGKNLKKKIEK